VADRSIFRDTAVEAYRRRANKDIVPRLTSWPIIIGLWVLLAVLLAGVVVAWSVHVPVYVSAQGVIPRDGAQAGPSGGGTAAALFLPPDQAGRIRTGEPVRGQIGSSGGYAAGEVTQIRPGVISPGAARDRYGVQGATDVIAQPSRVVIVRLDDVPRGSEESRLDARIQVSSQPILAYFPGLGRLLGSGT
jgi:hypothetical protein